MKDCMLALFFQKSKSMIKLMIVEDHQIFREGLKTFLSAIDGLEVIGEASDGMEALDQLEFIHPDIVITDIQMPKMGGVELGKEILLRKRRVKVVAMSSFGEEGYLHDIVSIGAQGFILKNADINELELALRTIAGGGQYFSPQLLPYFTSKYIHENSASLRLTRRELEVLSLVAQGFSNPEIAEKLFVSRRTIDGHKANMISKTGSKNIVDLLVYAIKKRVIKI